MSAHTIKLADAVLVVGWDKAKRVIGPDSRLVARTEGTYFAQLWDRSVDRSSGAPRRAAGYHELERIPPVPTEGYDSRYPLTLDGLLDVLIEWGVGPNVRAQVETVLGR